VIDLAGSIAFSSEEHALDLAFLEDHAGKERDLNLTMPALCHPQTSP
jgi:hypothetical protein